MFTRRYQIIISEHFLLKKNSLIPYHAFRGEISIDLLKPEYCMDMLGTGGVRQKEKKLLYFSWIMKGRYLPSGNP